MPTLLKIENYPDSNVKDNAQLSALAAAAQDDIVVDGQENMDVDDFLFIGRVGQQSLDPVEKAQVQSIAGLPTIDLVSNLTYQHPQYSPVKAVYGDQIQLYRAAAVGDTAPADASFSTLGSPVNIDAGQAETEFIDDTGSSLFWYKYRFYNSDSAAFTSDLEDVDAMRGQEFGNYTTVAAIRKEASITNNPYLTDSYVREQRREAESVINTAISGIYTVPLDAPVPGIIERATKLLAAGYILKREGLTERGQNKIDEVLGTKDKPGIITGIVNGDTPLDDGAGSDLVTQEHVTGWPNRSTATTPVSEGGSKRKFRMGNRY